MQTVSVGNDLKGLEIAREKLYELVDKKTVLFLSGGRTPIPLYKKLAKEKVLRPGAVAIVDERYGPPFHNGSNEKMMKDTGFLNMLSQNNSSFYPTLENKSLRETTIDYDETVRYLLSWFPKSIAVLGMGTDGHIASLPPKNPKLKEKSEKFVDSFSDFPGELKERISLTFNAISAMDQIILLVFGNDKKKALKLLFEDGPVDELPARFLNSPKIAAKVTLITDQRLD